jgi:hypothetical protein
VEDLQYEWRYDSAVRLNPHLHVLVLDGVYTEHDSGPQFHETPPPQGADIEELTKRFVHRVIRYLRKKGLVPGDEAPAEDLQDADDALAVISNGAAQGRRALGPRAGAWARRIGRDAGCLPVVLLSRRSARCHGFGVHADVRVAACARDRLEHLVRYLMRPAIALERLSLTEDGKVLYRFKRTFADGSHATVLEPLEFLERLAALIPRPRRPLLTYHGVLAPAAKMRPQIVPAPAPSSASTTVPCSATTDRPRATKPYAAAYYLAWAELLKRVFLIDALTCPSCGGPRRIIACLTEPRVVRTILHHLRLPTEPPRIAPARPPPNHDNAC